MDIIDTIDSRLIDIPVVTYEDTPNDAFFREQSAVYFELPKDTIVSVKSIQNIVEGNVFKLFSDWMAFPEQYKETGICVICECSTNIGFELVDPDSVLCNACLCTVVQDTVEWIQENPSDALVDLL